MSTGLHAGCRTERYSYYDGPLSCWQYMARFSDLLDLNRMYCNDLHSMAETYGIEAASRAIVKVSPPEGTDLVGLCEKLT